MHRRRIHPVLIALAAVVPACGGCLFVPLPMDVHAGPGGRLRIADADTREPLPDATVLVERYRIEGAMHAAPVVLLHQVERLPLGPDGYYELPRHVVWQHMWLVWMPEVRHSPVREVVALKVFTPQHQTAWFAVAEPLEGLKVVEEEQGPTLYLRRLRTAAGHEAAIRRIAQHAWPPGSKPMMADIVVPPEINAQLAPIMIERLERLLAEFPNYLHADRVRVFLDRWRKALPQDATPGD